MKNPFLAACSLGACYALSAGQLSAAVNGGDDASNAAYSGGWTNGSNGNPATFGGWNLYLSNNGATSSNAGYFLGDSTALNSGSGANINTGGNSFGLYGHDSASAGNGYYANASRNLTSALAAGQSFSFDLAVNYRNGNKGVDVFSGGGTLLTFAVANDDYVVSSATTGNGSIGNAYSSNTAFHLTFTQTSDTGGTWTIARSGGVTDLDSGTYSGSLTGFHLFDGGTDNSDSANNLYANNFAVVPEPATWLAGLLTCGAVGLRFAKRRRVLA